MMHLFIADMFFPDDPKTSVVLIACALIYLSLAYGTPIWVLSHKPKKTHWPSILFSLIALVPSVYCLYMFRAAWGPLLLAFGIIPTLLAVAALKVSTSRAQRKEPIQSATDQRP
jgi:hypothetical protein